MSSGYFLCAVVQSSLHKALREEDENTVRSIFIAIFNDWPSEEDVLMGEGANFALTSKEELLLTAKTFLEGKGHVVHFNEKHGVKITSNTGSYWSANSPTSVM